MNKQSNPLKLVASNEFFKKVFDNSSSGIIVLEPIILNLNIIDFIVVYANDQAHVQGRRVKGEYFGQSIKALLVNDKFNLFEFYSSVLKSGISDFKEVNYPRQDGSNIWIKIIASKVEDKLCLSITDITGHKNQEEELKETIAHQEFLADVGKILSSSIDYKNNLTKVAKLAAKRIADWISIEILEDEKVDMVAVAHLDPKKSAWAKELRKKYPVNLQEEGVLQDVLLNGHSRLIPYITEPMIQAAVKDEESLKLVRKIGFQSVMVTPILINKRPIGAIQFISTKATRLFDSKDLVVAEELSARIALTIQNARLFDEIKEKEKQFNALYDSNIIGMIYKNDNHEIYQANEAFLSMIGYSRDWFNKHKLYSTQITPKEYAQIDASKIKDVIEKGFVSPWEKEYIKKDGSQVPVIIGAIRLDKKQKRTISFVLDITERKKLEQRKDEFLGIASHELKTPLTSIKGYVQILERIIHEMGDEKAANILDKTNNYIDKLNSLIADLLDVSRIQAGKLQFNLEVFNINDLVCDNIQGLQQTTDHKIILNSTVEGMVKGDLHRLDQVMTNLLTNAIKYSPNANKVIIDVSNQDNFIQVAIKDFGIGIEDEYKKKLFQRFYRVETSARKFSGLGIGLYISSEIIKRHKGKIWVESKAGEGSKFYFTLPIYKEKKRLNAKRKSNKKSTNL